MHERKRALEGEIAAAVADLQADCPHEELVRVPFKESIVVDHEEKVGCLLCKRRRYGWGQYGDVLSCRYNSKIQSIRDVTFDEFCQLMAWHT